MHPVLRFRAFWPVLLLALLTAMPAKSQTATSDPIIQTLSKELAREQSALGKQATPPYYMSYNVGDEQTVSMTASYGSIVKSDSSRHRMLLVDLRVGDYSLDNTHQIRASNDMFARGGARMIPFENNDEALRLALWRETDQAYKAATERLQQVRTNKTVKVAEEDTSGDFSKADASNHYYEAPIEMSSYFRNRSAWEARLRRYSALFAGQKDIFEAKATLEANIVRKYFVSTEGGEIASNQLYVRVMVMATAKADDGMELPLYKSYFAFKPEDLPSDDTILSDVRQMIAMLMKMRNAPIVDPYAGPAILSGGAAGVFFHEIFGHRVEGHRQKNEAEGQTFKKKIGQRILPAFMDVYFDPNQKQYRGTDLLGCYEYDDEGVRGQRVNVVDSGVLENFLMSRSPIEGFSHSNGHARAQPGKLPVARQSNLVVIARQTVPVDSLRALLIAECKRAGKPYGLWFQQVEGGFTLTGRTIPNAFNVLPILVYRVYADGRPDELVRGVDLIGTPLATFERIIAAGNDGETFNGICGAESGWVPVSASSPSLLVREIEVQKKQKSQERLPILPAPDAIKAN
ncbi:MAG: metallopeptidase TldD-related protein [Bacteroidota bacterium]|nr:metallopeptidase TldD-related protein [Bacteroidota bacterium]MDP4232122.1 metallopeptidase TldD-related protein [Bacteroidota bacterium]MDP4241170.1 metallopeptidase TldD-related protein [Bacteroidota bacterium]MDP4286562.1 metallopeptidase TldD-related protein [Bacteroidota bacterium]